MMPERAVVEALKAARHALVTVTGLHATDQPRAYEDALAEGCDADGARGAQREATWVLDESAAIAQIDAALSGKPL